MKKRTFLFCVILVLMVIIAVGDIDPSDMISIKCLLLAMVCTVFTHIGVDVDLSEIIGRGYDGRKN